MHDTVFNKQLPLAIGCDHAGYELKETLKKALADAGWQIDDKGTFSKDSVDYPDFAHPVAEMVASGAASVGILICGSAIGVSITANRHKGVRAAVCWNEEVAALSRQHNNANIICLPARFISAEQAQQFVAVFLSTQFEGGRHERRVEKMEC
ncbi:MAG: ribose 5-phosphate isomerase B [Bacteroidetes bacterium 46-16]|nr:MAG: ribose 5-phosphate isomerase B [Bacteroidetes bacterium 46-16]